MTAADWRRDLIAENEALMSRIDQLTETLRKVLSSAHPDLTDHPTMYAAWAEARRVLGV